MFVEQYGMLRDNNLLQAQNDRRMVSDPMNGNLQTNSLPVVTKASLLQTRLATPTQRTEGSCLHAEQSS